MLSFVAISSANTVWDPSANGIFPPAAANWNDAANWTNGVPVEVGDSSSYGTHPKAVFNVANAAECQVTDVQSCGMLVTGDAGPLEPHNNVLRIMNGGHLATGATISWTGIGYNRDGGVVIVEEGGLIDMDSHLWIGMRTGGVGRLQLDGGTVLVADAIDWGREEGALGYIDLNSGTLQARYFSDSSSRGLMDIRYGKFILTGGEDSDRDRIQSRIDEGTIVAFGDTGIVNLELIDGNWTVSASIPEPATMVLLGLGGVLLRKRS